MHSRNFWFNFAVIKEDRINLNYSLSTMKAMYKSELARAAGVSYSTFRKWISTEKETLQQLGATPRSQLLTPAAVEYLCKRFVIDLYDKT